jgi:molecular chaperone GrpE
MFVKQKSGGKKLEEKNNQEQNQEEVRKEKSLTEQEDELIKKLQEEVETLKQKLQKTEEAAKRLSALYQSIQKDFEDYKIRAIKEREQIKEESIEKFAKAFLDVVDNFEKALESFKVSNDINATMQGIQMTHYQIMNLLQNYGIEKIEATGEFNPMEHEALETLKTKEYENNQIVKVLQAGYKYKGKVIRPAKVIVAISEEEEIT